MNATDLTHDELVKFRTIIDEWCDDLDRRADLPQNRESESNIFGKTSFMARRELLGSGGCVVARLDERYLDPNFRAMVAGAHEKIEAEAANEDTGVQP